MKINQVAQLTGLSTKAIRFYEQKGVIRSPLRTSNGYRKYNQTHLNELNMVKRSRLVGFSLEECKILLEMFRDPNRRSGDVKQKAQIKMDEIDLQIKELNAMKAELKTLIKACPGNDSACCPIIEALSSLDNH